VVGVITFLLVLGAVVAFTPTFRGARARVDPAYWKRIGKVFGIVNATQWTLVFIVGSILHRRGLDWLVVPAIAIIGGLHFLPLAKLFQHALYYVTGCLLISWATLAALLLPANSVPAIAGIGTGCMLWITAAILLLSVRS